ncbi:MAG TPA: hypothetical protein VF484_02300 [Candidatus Limnocylindrales bacterium]
MSRRRPAAIAIATGLGLALVAGRLSPTAAPPLYDGVTVVEPYVWLDPPSGAPGNPTGNHATVATKGGTSPLIALDTQETSTPQAQILVPPGALQLPAGTTSLTMSIKAVEPAAPPTDGHIDGNTYRITIVTQTGAPVTAQPGLATVVMRATAPPPGAITMELYSNGTWTDLPTDTEGPGDQFRAVVTSFGDFALVLPGPAGSAAPSAASTAPTGPAEPTPSAGSGSPAPASGSPPVALYGIAIGLVLLGLLATAFLPRRTSRHAKRGWSDRPPPRMRR